jgi:hypothetical protein
MQLMPSRREVLSAATALPVLGQHSQAPLPATGSDQRKVFRRPELNLVRDLAETILPRTDTPGAADANVHLDIDRVLAGNRVALAAFRKGLHRVEEMRKSGKDLVTILAQLSSAKDPFFRQLKDLTIDGYYSAREGLAMELGWTGYTPQQEFPGCTHPEHQG